MGVGEDRKRDNKEIGDDEQQHEAFPAPETAGRRHHNQCYGRDRDGNVLAHPEIAEGEVDAYELGDDREEIEDEQVAHREHPPKATEALLDEPGMAHAGDRPEPDDHFLVDNEHGDQQRQHPQKAVAIVLARLGVGGDASSVVVPDHDDDPWADNRGEGEQACTPTFARADIVLADRAEGTTNVPNVGFVEDSCRGAGASGRRCTVTRVVGHGRWTSGLVGRTRCLLVAPTPARAPARRPCPVPTCAPEVGKANLYRRSVLFPFVAQHAVTPRSAMPGGLTEQTGN